MRNKLSLLLIIAGVMLALYPLYTYAYSWYEQYRLQAALESTAVDKAKDLSPAGEPAKESIQAGDENPVPEGTPPGEMASGGEFNGALLEIPDLNLKVAVVRGTTQPQLAKGPGWYEESALPGQGNTCIAGHRTMHGAWFRHLDQLEPEDPLVLTFEHERYVYRVERVFPIANNDWSVIQPTEYPALTLTTCHPPGSASQRLVVRAALDTEQPRQDKDYKMAK